VPAPLNEAKAELFRLSADPVRVPVLERLCGYGIVTASRDFSTVVHALAETDASGLVRVARRGLSVLLVGQRDLLAESQAADSS
jgi:hypothetical protein